MDPEKIAPNKRIRGFLEEKNIKAKTRPGKAECPMASPMRDCPFKTVIVPKAAEEIARSRVPIATTKKL